MDGLEDGGVRTDVRAWRDAQPADEARGEVAHDVAVQVREHQHVVQLGLLDELHAHVVDDAVLELDPAGVVRRDGPAALEEQPVGQLHDVRLVHGRDLAPAVGDRVLEREAGDPLRGLAGDDLDALRGIPADAVLDARVQVLGVLPDDDEVDAVEAADDALHRAGRPQVRVQPQRLAERHVDAAEALPHGRRDRPLDGDLVAPDRLENGFGERRAVGGNRGLAGLDDLPLELDAGRVKDAARRLRQLRPDAVAGDQGDSVGHAAILATRAGRRPARRQGEPASRWAATIRERGAGMRRTPARPCQHGRGRPVDR